MRTNCYQESQLIQPTLSTNFVRGSNVAGVKIMNHTLDFNDANKLQPKRKRKRVDVELIRQALLSRIEDVLFYLLQVVYIKNNCFHIGNY